MHPVLDRVYQRATKYLPAETSGRIDLLRPSLRASWGGALNGQEHRRRIVRELAKAISFQLVVETGTYRGTSTEFFSAVFGVPIESVEQNPRFFAYSRRRLALQPDVSVVLGDSRDFLRKIASRAADGPVFAYLDAHWDQDLPLAEELSIVAGRWPQAVIMIDDFQVPGDDGYFYDDYGSGNALTESYLPSGVLRDWGLFYPSVGSESETGARRGSCTIVSPVMTAQVEEVRSLRLARRL